jgi:hypothetical protein
LGIFADNIAHDKSNWYEHELDTIAFEDLMSQRGHYSSKIKAFVKYHWSKLRSMFLFATFIALATVSALQNPEFSFVNALYFAVSSLSTGGLYALPHQPDWVYGITGVYAALGVPVMAMAMGTLASFFIHSNSIEDTLEQIREPVDETEVQMLTDFDIANNDGEIDKAEFIILCMVRTGAASPHLIKLIMEYFNELDKDGSGSLSIEEICRKASGTHHKAINEAILKQAHRFSAMGEYIPHRNPNGSAHLDGMSGDAAKKGTEEMYCSGSDVIGVEFF